MSAFYGSGGDFNLPLADLQNFLARTVAAHFRRRRKDAQQFVGNFEMAAVVEREFHHPRFLVQLDFCGNWRVFAQTGHGEKPLEPKRGCSNDTGWLPP